MSLLSAAASDEDGDTISSLKGRLGRANALCRIRLDRIRELETMLYAVGAGGVGKVEQPPVVKQEPVAVVTGYYGGYPTIRAIEQATVFPAGMALYTHPQPRQPLTPEQIMAAWNEAEGTRYGFFAFARAIERAHGIGGDA